MKLQALNVLFPKPTPLLKTTEKLQALTCAFEKNLQPFHISAVESNTGNSLKTPQV